MGSPIVFAGPPIDSSTHSNYRLLLFRLAMLFHMKHGETIKSKEENRLNRTSECGGVLLSQINY